MTASTGGGGADFGDGICSRLLSKGGEMLGAASDLAFICCLWTGNIDIAELDYDTL